MGLVAISLTFFYHYVAAQPPETLAAASKDD